MTGRLEGPLDEEPDEPCEEPDEPLVRVATGGLAWELPFDEEPEDPDEEPDEPCEAPLVRVVTGLPLGAEELPEDEPEEPPPEPRDEPLARVANAPPPPPLLPPPPALALRCDPLDPVLTEPFE